MRILIAEDDAVSRRILQVTVERFGHDCVIAEDGLEAWELYGRLLPDVLITDWMMPGLDGLELCRRVRADSQRHCYVIVLTALGDHEHALAGADAGADDHLTTPMRREELQVRLLAAARVTDLHKRLADREAELEHLTDRLHKEARRDPLTQLGNRLRLDEDLAALQARASRYGQRFTAALCDLDRFKNYNDRFGHLAGDEALRSVARAVTGSVRSGDAVYRYGGEELLVVLPAQDPAGAALALERVRSAVQGLGVLHPDNRPSGVMTVSVGAATHQAEESIADLLRRADTALYEAKAEGRDRVVVDPGVEALATGTAPHIRP